MSGLVRERRSREMELGWMVDGDGDMVGLGSLAAGLGGIGGDGEGEDTN